MGRGGGRGTKEEGEGIERKKKKAALSLGYEFFFTPFPEINDAFTSAILTVRRHEILFYDNNVGFLFLSLSLFLFFLSPNNDERSISREQQR